MQRPWGRRVLLCGRHGNEARVTEKENLGVKGSRWGLSRSCCILLGCVNHRWILLQGRVGRASLAFQKNHCVEEKDVSCSGRTQGRRDGGLDQGGGSGSDEKWPHTGSLKVKLPGFAVGQEVG